VHSGCRRNCVYKKGWLLRSSSSVRWLDICFLGYPCGAAAASIVFLGILMQLLLQLFPWTLLCSAASSVFLDILVQLLLQLYSWTFLCSCCFDCFCRYCCAAAASIVFLDTLVQLLLQLFFLGHSCAAVASIVFLGTFLCSCFFKVQYYVITI
jgi:hypothetical protein